jgi:hypothetical protein
VVPPQEKPTWQSTPPPMPDVSRQRSKRRWLVLIPTALIVLLGLWFFLFRSNPSQPSTGSSNSNSGSSNKDSHPDRIRLIAAGDFIAHDSVNKNAAKNGSYDYLQFMTDFQPIFNSADIRFCNDPILNGGQAFGITGYPNFNSPTEFVDDMNKLGCNLVNTASNHSFDKTQAVIDASVDAWAKQPNMLAVAGQNKNIQQHDTVHTFDVKGVKFAFLAYTTYLNQTTAPNNYGVNVFSKDFAASQIAQAKQKGAKVLIVSMRWGTEYSPNVNSAQKANAQFLADQGVSLVLGHGPHVLQPVDKLKGSSGNETVVWYSLGNFLNTQEPAEALFGALGVIDFKVSDGSISTLAYLPVYMHYEWSPMQKASGNLLARNNLKMYLLENTKQELIDKNQLSTSAAAQETRIKQTLNSLTPVAAYTKDQYYQ